MPRNFENAREVDAPHQISRRPLPAVNAPPRLQDSGRLRPPLSGFLVEASFDGFSERRDGFLDPAYAARVGGAVGVVHLERGRSDRLQRRVGVLAEVGALQDAHVLAQPARRSLLVSLAPDEDLCRARLVAHDPIVSGLLSRTEPFRTAARRDQRWAKSDGDHDRKLPHRHITNLAATTDVIAIGERLARSAAVGWFVTQQQSRPCSGRSVSDGVAVAVSDLPLAVLAPVHLGRP
jgi:hypothetical protein